MSSSDWTATWDENQQIFLLTVTQDHHSSHIVNHHVKMLSFGPSTLQGVPKKMVRSDFFTPMTLWQPATIREQLKTHFWVILWIVHPLVPTFVFFLTNKPQKLEDALFRQMMTFYWLLLISSDFLLTFYGLLLTLYWLATHVYWLLLTLYWPILAPIGSSLKLLPTERPE